jgi:hypothetical protein
VRPFIVQSTINKAGDGIAAYRRAALRSAMPHQTGDTIAGFLARP